jgi:hypothetical protein
LLAPPFLVGGEGDDDVPIPRVAFGAQPHDGRQVHRRVVLVVGDAAPVEGAVLLDEGERRERPVLGLGLDHVDVREQEDRLAGHVLAAQPRHEVPLAVGLLDDDHVGVGEAGLLEARGHGLRGLERTPRTFGGVDLDQLLEQVARGGVPAGAADVADLLGRGEGGGGQEERRGGNANRGWHVCVRDGGALWWANACGKAAEGAGVRVGT